MVKEETIKIFKDPPDIIERKLKLAQLSLELGRLVRERQTKLNEIGEYLIKIDTLLSQIAKLSNEIEAKHGSD